MSPHLKNTDVSCDWKENNLNIKEYLREVQAAVTVDRESDCNFPLLMMLTADLALRGLYRSRCDTSQ